MLKLIPYNLSPDFVKTLMEMGHGDEIVIGDGNFPAASIAQRLIRCDGHGVPEILDAILQLYPLDQYVKTPVSLMAVVAGDTVPTPVIWSTYKDIIAKYEQAEIEYLERFEFYERASKAYVVVATGESAIYANVILKKGVVIN